MKLTADESRALAAALRDPARFHSDGRVVAMFCATIAVLCIPLIIVLVVEGRSSFHSYYDDVPLREVFMSLRSLVYTVPELVGAAVLAIIGIGHVVYGVRTYGRHGHVITPFGVARIRGNVKRLIRYAELDSVKLIERRPPQHRIIATELELKAKDGRTLSLFGFGVTKQKALIEADVAKLVG